MMKRLFMIVVLLMGIGYSLVAAQEQETEMSYDVSIRNDDTLGAFLVDTEGMTLYTFDNDEVGISNCNEGCDSSWPPYTVEAQPTLDPALSGRLSLLTRENGDQQVMYNGMPLYYWVGDSQAGDTTGDGVGDVWFVADMPTVGLSANEDLGAFLVDSAGMTLYIFTNDDAGVSNCNDGCDGSWPPVTVESADSLDTQAHLIGEFSVIERADGQLQVTYNEMPLYRWVGDTQPDDATGQGVGDVWFVATTPTVADVPAEGFDSTLVGSTGMTLYTFANDDAGVSNCNEGCAESWMPLIVATDDNLSIFGDMTGDLSVIEREDGHLQVAYNEMPLYYWAGDILPGDTTGDGVGDVWFVAQAQ